MQKHTYLYVFSHKKTMAPVNNSKTQLAGRSRLYFAFQAGNCHAEGTNSYKLSELYDHMTNTFLCFQEDAKLPNLCSILKVPEYPTEEDWDVIKQANDKWSESAVDNVYKSYQMLKRTLRNIYVPSFSISSGENWDQGLNKCIAAHWANKKNKSRLQSNKRWFATGKHEKINDIEDLPEDCPQNMFYNSKMYPEAIIFTLYHDHNCLRLLPSDTTTRVLAAAVDSNADDPEILAIVQSTKKSKGQHKSRAQIKREEANKRKVEKANETKGKLAKKLMTEESYARKADAAFQHAGAASRKQELESIMFAAKLDIYSKEEMKTMMDKHLRQTFHSNAAYEKVIDLTVDEEAEDDTAKSGRNPSLDILTQTGPDTFQSPTFNNNMDRKPAAKGSSNSNSNSNSTSSSAIRNNNTESSGRVDGVSKQLFTDKQDVQDEYDTMGLSVLGDISYKEQYARSVEASMQIKNQQPTLTQGGMDWLVPKPATLADYETCAGMVVLDGELCCAGEDYCLKPLTKSSMQCSVCRGFVHLDCAFSRGDQTIVCGKCFDLKNSK